MTTFSERLNNTHDGWNPVYERTVDGLTEGQVAEVTYVWGTDLSGSLRGAGGVGGLLAVNRDGDWYVPLYDANGNVTAYVSESGTIVAEYEYDAFGATISQSGSLSDDFRHRFSTKPWIASLGAYDYGERVYSPELRRWLSRDPIGEKGGVNLYAMCGNNPVSKPKFLCWRISKLQRQLQNLSLLSLLGGSEFGRKPQNSLRNSKPPGLLAAKAIHVGFHL